MRHILICMTIQSDYADVPPLTLGWRIQMALAHGRLKHADLMEKFEVSRETVSRWCRDHGAPPKTFILTEIAIMCGVSPRWLINGESPRHPGGDDGGSESRLGESNPRPIHYLATEFRANQHLSSSPARSVIPLRRAS